jgi:hypothetical protein
MAQIYRALSISVLRGGYCVLHFPPDAGIPAWATQGDFFSITRSEGELSVVCGLQNLPAENQIAKEWRVLKVHGPFSFDEIGVLASLVQPLANEEVSVFAVSTFDTDYLLVPSDRLQKAIQTLRDAGHSVMEG